MTASFQKVEVIELFIALLFNEMLKMSGITGYNQDHWNIEKGITGNLYQLDGSVVYEEGYVWLLLSTIYFHSRMNHSEFVTRQILMSSSGTRSINYR